MFSKYLINILLLCTAALVNAGDDYCWEVKSVDELQQAIGEQLEKDPLQEGHPTVVSLCKGTKILFRKGDATIKFPELGKNLSFVLKCEESGTCVMDGGLLQKDERLFVGIGGFSTILISTGSLFIEGIVFQNFGVTEYAGVFLISLDSNTARVYFYKCVFFENIAKGIGGGAVVVVGSKGLVRMEAVHFKGNRCPNGYGGAFVHFGTMELQIEKGIFNHNEGKWGGAIFFSAGGGYARWFMDGIELQSNKASRDGGAIYYGHALAEWENVRFKGNDAVIGEAYYDYSDSNLRGQGNFLNKDLAETTCNIGRSFIVY